MDFEKFHFKDNMSTFKLSFQAEKSKKKRNVSVLALNLYTNASQEIYIEQ